jgi:hypothetical protein
MAPTVAQRSTMVEIHLQLHRETPIMKGLHSP